MNFFDSNVIRIDYNLNDKNIVSYIQFFDWLLFVFCVIFVMTLAYLYSGFRFTISFEDSLEYRLYMRTVNLPTLVRYLFPLTGTVFLPYLFIRFLNNKKYFFVFLIFILGVLNYSINGMKTWLVIYLLELFVFIFSKQKNKYKYMVSFMSLFLSVLTILAIIIYNKFNSLFLVSILRRVLLIPAGINYLYIDFFSINEKLFLRESVFRIFFKSPYKIGSSFLIGGMRTGNYEANANNGLLGDAYSNFGLIGVFLYPLILVMTFYIVLKLTKKTDINILIPLLLILVWNLINCSFFTWLLTGGVIVLCFILLMNQKRQRIN